MICKSVPLFLKSKQFPGMKKSFHLYFESYGMSNLNLVVCDTCNTTLARIFQVENYSMLNSTFQGINLSLILMQSADCQFFQNADFKENGMFKVTRRKVPFYKFAVFAIQREIAVVHYDQLIIYTKWSPGAAIHQVESSKL